MFPWLQLVLTAKWYIESREVSYDEGLQTCFPLTSK
jgi:hypothetical protein